MRMAMGSIEGSAAGSVRLGGYKGRLVQKPAISRRLRVAVVKVRSPVLQRVC